MDDIFKIIETEEDEPRTKMIVRLITSQYSDRNGVYLKKSLKYLKRKCEGYNCLDEDCKNMGADEVIPRIINLYEVPDGIYEINLVNVTKDWETGYDDDWDYELVEYKEK